MLLPSFARYIFSAPIRALIAETAVTSGWLGILFSSCVSAASRWAIRFIPVCASPWMFASQPVSAASPAPQSHSPAAYSSGSDCMAAGLLRIASGRSSAGMAVAADPEVAWRRSSAPAGEHAARVQVLEGPDGGLKLLIRLLENLILLRHLF